MSSKNRSYIRNAIGLIVAAALLYFLLNQIKIENIEYVFDKLSVMSLILIILLYALIYLFRSLRFLALMATSGVRLQHMYFVVSIHTFLNHIMPARTGELSYPYLLKKHKGIGYALSGSGLVVVRLFDLIFSGALFLLAVYYESKTLGGSIPSILFAVASAVIILVIIMLNLKSITEVILKVLKQIFKKLEIDSYPAAKKIMIGMQEAAAALLMMRTKTIYFRLTALTAFAWLSTFGMFYVFMKEIAPSLSFMEVVLASVFSMVASLIPINTFGSIGTMEAGWALGFVFVGVPAEIAIASGFAIHFIVMILASLWASIGWMMLRRKFTT